MRALVTGGAGFIGSHLVEALLHDGQDVWAVDDLSTGNIRNIAAVHAHPHFRFVEGTITDMKLMADLVEQVDIVYHLAAAVGVRLIIEQAVETIETNIRGTEILLQLAKEHHAKVILASTSEVYGKNSQAPFSEEHDLVLGPTSKSRWGYACSKAIDEFLALAYWRQWQLPIVIVRFFNTVGPRQTGRYGMVVPTFVEQALTGKALTVFGDGTQSRCFTYVTDAIHAVMQLAACPTAVGEVFNIGNTEEITITALAQRIKHLTGSASEIVYVPYDQAYERGFEDMTRRVPDLRKIQRVIGYQPQVTTDQMLTAVIAFFRNLEPQTTRERTS